MERNNDRYGAQTWQAPQEFRHPAVPMEVGSDTVPYLRDGETTTVTLTPFKDHGRPAFIASTIKSSPVAVDAASSLSLKEGQRLNAALERTMELMLDEGHISNSMAVMSSRDRNKPDVFIINVGSSYSDSSLRLFCHIGKHEKKPVLIQDGRGTKKTSSKIEKELLRVGYSRPSKFGHNESKGRKR